MQISFSNVPIPNLASALATGAFAYALVFVILLIVKRADKMTALGSILSLATYWWLGTVGMAVKLYLLARDDIEVSSDFVFGIFITSIISAAIAIGIGVNTVLSSSIREDEEKSIRYNHREEAFA